MKFTPSHSDVKLLMAKYDSSNTDSGKLSLFEWSRALDNLDIAAEITETLNSTPSRNLQMAMDQDGGTNTKPPSVFRLVLVDVKPNSINLGNMMTAENGNGNGQQQLPVAPAPKENTRDELFVFKTPQRIAHHIIHQIGYMYLNLHGCNIEIWKKPTRAGGGVEPLVADRYVWERIQSRKWHQVRTRR